MDAQKRSRIPSPPHFSPLDSTMPFRRRRKRSMPTTASSLSWTTSTWSRCRPGLRPPSMPRYALLKTAMPPIWARLGSSLPKQAPLRLGSRNLAMMSGEATSPLGSPLGHPAFVQAWAEERRAAGRARAPRPAARTSRPPVRMAAFAFLGFTSR